MTDAQTALSSLVAGGDIPQHGRTRHGRQSPLRSILGKEKGCRQQRRLMVWSLATQLMGKAEDGILHHGRETLGSHFTCCPCQA